jgi:CheY-like chemotaxis protein
MEPGKVVSILLVEDDRVSQTVISHILRRNQFRVQCAESGGRAVSMAARESFDLILMDLQMPEMDGLEATALIRVLPEYETVPIIALTANHSDQYREVCQRHGMQAFLSKPVHPAELLAYVRRYV